MRAGTLKAMISSTSLDLPAHRAQVVEACLSQGVFPIDMKHLPARDINPLDVDHEMVDDANVYIGIYAHRYGGIAEGQDKSYTELEFDRAVARKIPCLIFLMSPDHPVLPKDIDMTPRAQEKLAAFKERAKTGRICKEFTSPEDLRSHVITALSQWKAEMGDTVSPPEAPKAGVSELPKPDSTERFLASLIWLLGAIALFWQGRALGAVCQYEIIWQPIWGDSYPSQVVIGTLFMVGALLVALHVAMHGYQGFASQRGLSRWFPERLFTLQIPSRLAWLRVAAFVLLIAVPTVMQVYWVKQRMIDQMEIVWKDGSHENFALQKWQLLAFPKSPDNSPGGIFSPHWRWKYWYDAKAEKLRLERLGNKLTQEDEKRAEFLKRDSVLLGVGLQPWFFVLETLALLGSLIALFWKALQKDKRLEQQVGHEQRSKACGC